MLTICSHRTSTKKTCIPYSKHDIPKTSHTTSTIIHTRIQVTEQVKVCHNLSKICCPLQHLTQTRNTPNTRRPHFSVARHTRSRQQPSTNVVRRYDTLHKTHANVSGLCVNIKSQTFCTHSLDLTLCTSVEIHNLYST